MATAQGPGSSHGTQTTCQSTKLAEDIESLRNDYKSIKNDVLSLTGRQDAVERKVDHSESNSQPELIVLLNNMESRIKASSKADMDMLESRTKASSKADMDMLKSRIKADINDMESRTKASSKADMDNLESSIKASSKADVDNLESSIKASSKADMDNLESSIKASSKADMDNLESSIKADITKTHETLNTIRGDIKANKSDSEKKVKDLAKDTQDAAIAASINVYARIYNGTKVKKPEDELLPLYSYNGLLIPNFPKTLKEVRDLKIPAVVAILDALRTQPAPTPAEKRNRLKEALGLLV